MSATLNVVVSINSTTVMQTYWTAPKQAPTEQPIFFYSYSPVLIGESSSMRRQRAATLIPGFVWSISAL